jgi:hypothetical protein
MQRKSEIIYAEIKLRPFAKICHNNGAALFYRHGQTKKIKLQGNKK